MLEIKNVVENETGILMAFQNSLSVFRIIQVADMGLWAVFPSYKRKS